MNHYTYGIVGRGKLARHLVYYFQQEGLPVVVWHRESPVSPYQTLGSCDVIIVAIKDGEIKSWIEAHPDLKPRLWVHCSGALSLDGVQGMHPLYTFTPTLYELSTYQRIPFIYEQGRCSFHEIFPNLKNPHYAIRQEDKVLYHGLCVIMGNLPTLLWQNGLNLAQTHLNLPHEVFSPFLMQTLINTIDDPDKALTGPLDRGDWQTITNHLHDLPEGPLKQIYQQFLTIFSRYPCPY